MVDRCWTGFSNLTQWWKLGGQPKKQNVTPQSMLNFTFDLVYDMNLLIFIHQSYPRGQLQIKDEFHSHHLFLEIDVPDCWHNQLATLSPEAQ